MFPIPLGIDPFHSLNLKESYLGLHKVQADPSDHKPTHVLAM